MLLALIKKEMLALLRDLHGLAALLLMPVLFIVIMSLALKDVYNPPIQVLPYAVDSQDAGTLAPILLDNWAKEHGAAQALPTDWSQALLTGELKYVIQLDADTSERLMPSASAARGAETVAPPIRLLVEPTMDKALLSGLQGQLTGLVSAVQVRTLSVVLEAMSGNAAALGAAQSPGASGSNTPLVEVKRTGSLQIKPTSVQQNVPAWLVFGMFFVMSAVSGLWLVERDNGVMARLRSFGVPSHAILLSKVLPYLGVNALQAALMLSVGVWLMPLLGADALQLGGIHWSALLLVLASISAAAVGLAILVACLVRTPAQAGAVVPIVNVLMAAIGGIMVPKFVMPSFMQRLAELSPMNWGLEGLLTVLLRAGDVGAVLPYASRLLWFAGVTFVLALLLLRGSRLKNA
ncbi:ABC transporter [Hydrogenophaga crassostreae]|uniref:ABC transporter n=2 Tax=Hydrogenophaga crassostreae TaxID=1763535 RepID=A0A167H505_9BURK|nr:ABC transporter [Hydrogenophaga crassostreae]OAD40293.1 ABC transporter [Hydrogenophaga crassostreae]